MKLVNCAVSSNLMMRTLTAKQRAKSGAGHKKEEVFVASSLDEQGNPHFLKMRVTPNIEQASVKRFAHAAFADGCTIHSDGYCSYLPAIGTAS